ncbi:hypothetical protein D3C73_1058610 [compost metagenome]
MYALKLEIESIVDSSNSTMELSDPDVMKHMEEVLSEEVEERIHEAFDASLAAGSDAFQLGAYLAWYHPDIWKTVKKDWSSIYKEKVTLKVETKAGVRLLGAQKR